MSVAGPVEQAAMLARGLAVAGRVGAGGQQAAVLPDIGPRQAANANGRPDRTGDPFPVERRRDAEERPAGRPADRQATPFLAQLLAQATEPPTAAGPESQRLAGRRQAARLAAEDPAAEAQKRRAAARQGDDPEASAGAYDRVKLSAREFAARRYGVARDADGVFFFQASSIDIRA